MVKDALDCERISNMKKYLIFIPPVYKVYRGYIVFAFSVTMLVCQFVNFFFPSKISQELLDIGL